MRSLLPSSAPGTARLPAASNAACTDAFADAFAALVAWQRQHGRHGLPWQTPQDPYRVWLSEVMLQQTQVATVRPYFARFVQRWPSLQALAAAPLEDVLALWSGLGYYSRARKLHACARQLCTQHGGQWPRTAAALQRLPGVGASTAAAIAAFCFGERVSILDGNARRVLARLLAFDADLSRPSALRSLWQQAHDLLPPQASHADMVAYTQGLMDLGTSVCTRTRPRCALCPLAALCQARSQQREADLPLRAPRPQRLQEHWYLLVLQRPDGALWLEPRPERGIWAGLYTPPVRSSLDAALVPPPAAAVAAPCLHPPQRHALTHRELHLHWVQWRVQGLEPEPVPETDSQAGPGLWLAPVADAATLALGLPAPIRAWLAQLWAQAPALSRQAA